MKLGVCLDWRNHAALRAAKEAGAEYAELVLNSFEHVDPKEVAEGKAFLEELGLPVLSFNGMFPWSGLRVTGKDVNPAQIDAYLEDVLAASDVFGAPYVVFGSSGARHIEEGDTIGGAQSALLRLFRNHVIPAFEKHDRICLIEPLTEDNLVHTVADGEMYVRILNHPRVRVLADFYHTSLLGEDVQEYVGFGRDILHCHIASPSCGRHVPLPGDGDEEKYREAFAILRKIGYRGGVSLEGGYGPDMAGEMKDSLAYLRTLL